MVTGAVARGRYLGRVCVLSFRTHAAEIDMLVDDLGAALAEIVPIAV
jgi:aromatic-L-amino-acid decarboxylase